MLQTHTQSLTCIRAVINGEDLVNSRCIKRMKAQENPKRDVTFSSCARQFASPHAHFFARINKWRLGTSLIML